MPELWDFPSSDSDVYSLQTNFNDFKNCWVLSYELRSLMDFDKPSSYLSKYKHIWYIYRVSPSWVHWFEGLSIFECFEYLIDRDRALFPQSHIFKSDPGIPSKSKQISISSIWVNELISIRTVSTYSTRTSRDVGKLRHRINVAFVCLLC